MSSLRVLLVFPQNHLILNGPVLGGPTIDHLKNPVVRDIRDQDFELSLSDLPNYPTVQFNGLSNSSLETDSDADVPDKPEPQSVLTIRRPPITKCPPPPEELDDWIRPGWEKLVVDVHTLQERNVVDENGQTRVEIL
jgi:hypothetical protein